ncbi:MAG: hypothetical protein HY907_08835 [Deltaproteobacteria bacterium]|nr:hypothetical protein [Deltaproteobacteria bacterium]
MTQRLRAFLDDAGAGLPAWATVEDVTDRLWTTLRARRADTAFWRELPGLIAALRSGAARDARTGLADPSAELLGRSRVEDLIAELRRALDAPPEPAGRGAVRRGRPHLSVSLAACLLLLGSAVACQPSAPAAGAGDVESPAPTLASYVEQSDLAADAKAELRECLPGLPVQRSDHLVALFRDSPPDVVARTLELLLAPGAECGPPVEVAPPPLDAGVAPGQDGGVAEPPPADAGSPSGPEASPEEAAASGDADSPEDTRRRPPEPPPVPVYKGVSFD